ncbi:MAG: hypothetical protein HQK88_02510 [Nitrospirae bacterium]|nr:hypothetical protein [Nitrospirota bacterium]MBF0534347.1 hypothetical protein [Nitrospirota bacterium]MBF0615672.1 hypothetical protein [Nitrospirota bacterium]
MYIFYRIFSFLLWPILIIGLIVFFIRRRHKKLHPSQNKEWYLQFALSKEDAVSQLFLLLSFFFLGVTLLAFNRDFGEPVSWRAIVFITSSAGLISAYYLKTIYTLVFSLVGLTGWWGAQAAQWIDGKNIKTSALFAGLSLIALIFYSLGHLHEKQMKFKRFALVYLVLGIIAVTGALFFFSTKPGIGVIGKMAKGSSFFGSWQLTLSLFVFLISLVGATLYAAAQKLLSSFELLAVFALTCLFGTTALLPAQTMFVQTGQYYYSYYGGNELSSTGVLWALIYNFAIFFELLGLIFSGYLRRETWLINLSALFLFLLVIVKYFDWFFTFLDKSIFFIGAGILLFVVGWFMEKGRRYMISNIKAQAQQIQQ